MSIANDWDFNFAAKTISHIDGILSYDTGSGTQPAVGQMIIGNVSGAVGKILARTGTVATGTLTLTNVIGQFEDNEDFDILSELMFDGVIATFQNTFIVGATLTGATSTSTIVAKFIEYNIDGVAGHGKIYGNPMSAAFTNNEALRVGVNQVAVVDGTGTDNDALLTALVSGTLAVPGTANTNNSIILHYDTGTVAIPVGARISKSNSGAGAVGYAQYVVGSATIGSIRIIDSDTTVSSWTNNDTIYILDCVYYNALVAGKVFSAGDVIAAINGTTPNAVGRVLSVIDHADSTGILILAGFSGTWQDTNDIAVKQADDSYVVYGSVEDATSKYLSAALANIPSGIRAIQRKDQGGIYTTNSLNILRSANALYSYAQDLYDELGQLDDDPPLDGNVKDQLYTVLNNYIIPDLSFRFIERGSFKDSANNNIFTNIQTVGAIADIGAWGYYYDATNPTPQPDMYIEQNGSVLRQDWLEGHLDVLLKVKTSTSPRYINPTVNALGQLINSAAFTVHLRPYLRTFDSNEVTQVGGIAVVALGNAKDLNNTTGQYSATFTAGVGTPFTVGEEFTTAAGKRGIITSSDTGATGSITYVLKSATNFVNTDAVTGKVSAATATLANPTNLVAGYSANIRVMTVDRRFTGGTTTGTFVIGETVTQSVSGATGYVMEDDAGTLYVQDASGTFTGTNLLTGAISGATQTPTATAAWGAASAAEGVPKDIGGGVGDKFYKSVVSANITGAAPQTVAKVYEWWKFLLRAESTLLQGGPGASTGTEGRIYRKAWTTFAEVRGAAPYGTKAGSLVIGAQGVFIEKFTLDTSDLRNIQLVDNLGATYNPPNLQTLQVSNLIAGVAAAVYRSTGTGLETILRNEFTVGAASGGYNQSANAYIKVAAGVRTISPLPNDVPDSGVLRVLDPRDSGDYLRFEYDLVDRTNNWFHLTQGIGQNTIGAVTSSTDLTPGDNTHVVFIEKLAVGTAVNNTIQYTADIPLFTVARKKGKKPFKTTGTFGSGGASIGAVLGSDDVVNMP
jgi:hypothetical protein